jgi:hypothetical protein
MRRMNAFAFHVLEHATGLTTTGKSRFGAHGRNALCTSVVRSMGAMHKVLARPV